MQCIGHRPKKLNVNEGFVVEAIDSFIKQTNFPIKLELKRILATKKYTDDKLRQNQNVLVQSSDEYEKIQEKVVKLRQKCNILLGKLRNEVM